MIWNTPNFGTGSLKWTSTISSKLLLETGFSFNRERYDNLYQPGILAERNTPAWYQNVRRNDTSTGLLWGASGAQLGNYPDRYNLQGARVVCHRHPHHQGRRRLPVGHLSSATTTPMPTSTRPTTTAMPLQVTVLNTPLRVQEDLDVNLGFYVQDTWNLNRLTLNYGVRFDRNKQTIVGQDAQIGRFANIAAYDDIQAFPTWNDFSPRMSVVYDISGNGRTADARRLQQVRHGADDGLRAAL